MFLFYVPIFSCPFSDQDLMPFLIMENLDTRLFIAGVEVSCWQDQLRQAVSISYLSIFKLQFIDFLHIFQVLTHTQFRLIIFSF